jgi:hypothetical protein
MSITNGPWWPFLFGLSFTLWVDENRTGSGPGSLRGQPAWGGGCDRVSHSTRRFNSLCIIVAITAFQFRNDSVAQYSREWRVLDPVASTTPRGLPAQGPRSAPGSEFDDPLRGRVLARRGYLVASRYGGNSFCAESCACNNLLFHQSGKASKECS